MVIFNSKDILGFNDLKFMLVGIPLVSIVMNLLLFGELVASNDILNLTICQGISLIYTLVFWLIIRQVHLQVTKRNSGYHKTVRRYMILVPSLILTFLLLKIFLQFAVDPYVDESLGLSSDGKNIIKSLSSFIFMVLIISLYEAAYLFIELQESQLEKEQLMKENISSQLESLKNQVNPHFLFNSLNTLANIIPEDQEKSIRFVSKLGKVYRYILEIKDKKLVTLAEELKFLKAYTFLINERFGENINITIQVPEEAMDKYVVTLCLQITFENAIKHNIITKKQPLTIEVFMDESENLVIRNNLQKKSIMEISPGMGLLNIKKRYDFFTHKKVHVEESTEYFTVVLPLLISPDIIKP